MIPTTFRCSSFRDQVVCPLPADPVSAHAPDFIAIFVHIRGILAVIRPLVWYPTKARNIDLIAGLRAYWSYTKEFSCDNGHADHK